jgi:hypothetical protein
MQFSYGVRFASGHNGGMERVIDRRLDILKPFTRAEFFDAHTLWERQTSNPTDPGRNLLIAGEVNFVDVADDSKIPVIIERAQLIADSLVRALSDGPGIWFEMEVFANTPSGTRHGVFIRRDDHHLTDNKI